MRRSRSVTVRDFHRMLLMSFSSPLGIGLSSDGEYMDLTLDQVEDADRIVEQMNEQMNEEIRVRNLTILKDDARPSMAMLAGL